MLRLAVTATVNNPNRLIFQLLKNVFFVVLLLVTIRVYGDGNSPSVMASGDWYKISVTRDGIYRITYAELRNLGISDPASVRIYGSGGAMLPEKPGKCSAGDLKEIPVWIQAKTPGTFTDGDCILFYGQGPVVWQYNRDRQEFEHALHLWDNQSCYFITSKAGGKRVTTEERPQNPATQTVHTFDEHLYHEEELENPLKSGRLWMGEDFRTTGVRQFPFSIPDIDPASPAKVNISFMSLNSSLAYLEVRHGNRQIARQPLPAGSEYQYVSEVSFSTSAFNPVSDNVPVELALSANGNGQGGWLNYIRLFARRRLNMASEQLFFRDTQSVGENRVAGFQITNCTTNTQVWDISDMHSVRRMDASLSGTTLSFVAGTERLREFVAFDPANGLLKPGFPADNRRTGNQNIHGITGVDMVIVSHPGFMDASEQLAGLHRDKDGLSVEAVTTEQVYNEFSSGMQDPAAIRNFMKYLYEKQPDGRFKYLLLMGDGSFDNKSNRAGSSQASVNSNYIVTYQSANSTHKTNSFVSDDFFGILDDDEPVETGKLKIGIGRLPVQSPEQAADAVGKIRKYIETRAEGDWPNLLGLLADDEDGNRHALQSENLADYINEYHPQYTVNKLYFDAFPQVVTADGHRYPEVVQQLDNLLNKGCLLVNYIGHGNESGLSEERVVNTTGISGWKNRIYPLFVAATCEFGRYDDHVRVTAGENLVLNSQGGGIALLTSTRLVYSSLNFQLNSSFFRELFTRPAAGDQHRLGDILRRAKNALEPSVNKLCFTLLGDPALKPVIPPDSVQTVSINGKPVAEPPDTLKANSTVTVRGNITGSNGQILAGFNGTVHLSLFDKARETTTHNNDGNASPMTFSTQTSTLYKGKATVKNGEFELSFIMPRDINYQYGFGKISYYAYSGDGAAGGVFRGITVGGSAPGRNDSTGPEIQLFINDTYFRDGGITDQNPELTAYLYDESGINTSDESIGHNITAVLNSDPSMTYYLNPYYEANLDDHTGGTVNYRISNLPVGDYELLFTAWDLENNPSQATIRFRVTASSKLQMANLYNYPNPFPDFTNIYFEFNMPDTEIHAELQIFDMSGRLLRSMKQTLVSTGYTSGRFQWDGYGSNGNKMRQGIYPYRVILKTGRGQSVWKASKMVIGY